MRVFKMTSSFWKDPDFCERDHSMSSQADHDSLHVALASCQLAESDLSMVNERERERERERETERDREQNME